MGIDCELWTFSKPTAKPLKVIEYPRKGSEEIEDSLKRWGGLLTSSGDANYRDN